MACKVRTMIFDAEHRNYSDGQWHCPFTPEWLERMARAVKHCKMLMNGQHVDTNEDSNEDFLSRPQDERGLPIGYCYKQEYWPTCCATYDYASIPDVVITNGKEDWPYRSLRGLLTA